MANCKKCDKEMNITSSDEENEKVTCGNCGADHDLKIKEAIDTAVDDLLKGLSGTTIIKL